MTPSRVGVVVINWNGLADTLVCLESLVAADPAPARIVVVDNGSTDGTVEALVQWRARRATGGAPVAIIALPVNRGFSAANNIGVELLQPDAGIPHFLLLNNDATVDPGFFAEIARALNAFPDAGLVAPTIYFTGRPGKVWYAGGHFVPFRARSVHDSVVPRDSTPVPTAFVTGCALLISRHAWHTLGPLPECYFLYYEDSEYSYRALQAGLRVLYVPRAIVHHAGSASTARLARPHLEHGKARSRALFVRRNFRGWARWAALAYLAFTKPGRAIWDALRGRPALGWAIFHGTLEGLLAPHGGQTPRPSLDGLRVHT